MNEATTVGQRFLQLISYLGISKNAFATSLDKTATVIQHLVDERNKPGFDLLCKVFEVYPNVSKDWLLQGQGPMLYDDIKKDSSDVGLTNKDGATEQKPIASASIPVPSAIPAFAISDAIPNTKPSISAPVAPVTAPPEVQAPETASLTVPSSPDTSWQTALYTQQMAHQLAMAELRNQHLQDQQRLMQQMMDLMQRQLSR
ncbi:hypothetical protein HMJ29_18420 [Hymenobacter taeanensis]|uniref:Helix-turn-helix transcriptional regulator n=1 Tax=Hymenobacter taeanensis TaxID=2735321 RepID=A0A6M6BLB3_9BACT|nr:MULTISPECIES: hypothetical protein [Hymenobacter]QJX48782.1 hypothetical protein HMJ29_18420 [Hymenobacter taeanensis]UOQ81714.1 hypothetical protein MUN83_02655 [Hymenobacter sp. 5414T-23]